MRQHTVEDLLKRGDELTNIGRSLSSERDKNRLLEQILFGAKRLTNANAGTLYLLTEDKKKLRFEILCNDDLGIKWGGTSGVAIEFYPVPLYKENDEPNYNNVVTYSVLTRQTVNIEDAYTSTADFDFSGTRKMDAKTGYRSKSFLTVPLKNHEDEIVGVLQLLNRKDEDTGEVISFDVQDQHLAESLASQAAVTLTNKALIEEQKQLFEAFIQVIAKSIDEKSPYTGGHCSRVPVIAMLLANAANAIEVGPLKNFHLSEDELYELKIAAWLHDCGKVATPEYVMDKATKLETLYDRIHEVNIRFEIIRRDLLIEDLQLKPEQRTANAAELQQKFATLADDQAFINKVNEGGEFLSEADQARIAAIGQKYNFKIADGSSQNILEPTQISNLQIARGTLNDAERNIINNHVVITLAMLNSLHYPKNLRQVPEIAASHHERMDGKGYPRHLDAKHLSMQARMVAIADVYEALTAADRPYKKGKTLTESLRILGFMAKEGHIDPDLFDVFVRQGVWKQYAEQHLKPEQIDEVDLSAIPGYVP